jgi:hypothetical protein
MQTLVPLKRRRPLWEIEWLMCHALGICLTDEEAIKLARQTGFGKDGAATPFEVHSHLVEGCRADRQMTRKVQKFLNQKYGWIMRRVDRVGGEGVEEVWRELVQQGETKGAFWAIMTRGDVTPELLRKIFGEVHMTCFGNVTKQIARIRKIARQGGELENQKQRLTKTQDRLSRVRSGRNRLKGEIREKEEVLQSLKEKLDSLKKLPIGTIPVLTEAPPRWRQKRTKLLGKLQQERNLRLLLEKKVKGLEKELEGVRQEKHSGQENTLPAPASSHPTTFSLEGKKVLFVGGLDRMENHYRQLIESLGGSFGYHSGYYGKGGEAFENKVKWADIVLLPINCVSHFASAIAKRLYKKEDKPFIPLHSTGLTSVYRALGMGIEREVGDES